MRGILLALEGVAIPCSRCHGCNDRYLDAALRCAAWRRVALADRRGATRILVNRPCSTGPCLPPAGDAAPSTGPNRAFRFPCRSTPRGTAGRWCDRLCTDMTSPTRPSTSRTTVPTRRSHPGPLARRAPLSSMIRSRAHPAEGRAARSWSRHVSSESLFSQARYPGGASSGTTGIRQKPATELVPLRAAAISAAGAVTARSED